MVRFLDAIGDHIIAVYQLKNTTMFLHTRPAVGQSFQAHSNVDEIQSELFSSCWIINSDVLNDIVEIRLRCGRQNYGIHSRLTIGEL